MSARRCFICGELAWKGADACKRHLDEIERERNSSWRRAALVEIAMATDLTPEQRVRKVADLAGSDVRSWLGALVESDRFRSDLT